MSNLWPFLLIFTLNSLSHAEQSADQKNAAKEIRSLLNVLKDKRTQHQGLQKQYHRQLLEQDDIISPQLQSQLTSTIGHIDEIAASIKNEAFFNGLKIPAAQLRPEILHPDVAVRTEFYTQKIPELLENELSQNDQLTISTQSLTSALPNLANQSEYPKKSLPINIQQRCSTGGFITPAVKPDVPADLKLHFNDFSSWKDSICRTPKQVKLSIDGKVHSIGCRISKNDDPNINTMLDNMQLCDPLLYGFYPVKNKMEKTQGACLLPKASVLGRRSIYSEDMKTEFSRKQKIVSRCESLASGPLSKTLQDTFPWATDSDLSLLLAAKLSLENQQQWINKVQRIKTHCQFIKKSEKIAKKEIEYDHCLSLIARVTKIEEAQNKLQKKVNSSFLQNSNVSESYLESTD